MIFLFLINYLLIQHDPELVLACFTKFAQSSEHLSVTRMISGLYLITILCFLVWDLFSLRKGYFRIKKMEVYESGDIYTIILNLKKQLKLHQNIQVYISAVEASPYVWGFFNYHLVLPAHLLKIQDSEKIRSILAHELIHIQDRDSLWMLASHIYKRLLFYHPLIYLLQKRHAAAVEIAADELAIRRCGVASKKLAESLIDMASNPFLKTGFLELHMSRTYKEIKHRIEALSQMKMHQGLDWKFSFSAICIVLVNIGFSLSQAQAQMPDSFRKFDEKMCTQVRDEQIIEAWLKLKPSSNRCE
jgi:beta-lactamase regulating signal transducer with metallopeptidase domain